MLHSRAHAMASLRNLPPHSGSALFRTELSVWKIDIRSAVPRHNLSPRRNNGALLPYTGAKTAHAITIVRCGSCVPKRCRICTTFRKPEHRLAENAMIVVLFISAVALVGLTFVPKLSR